ncbi:NAD(P)/FAD-dependent oxidoreductase [Iamia sp.]|uniref:flavin-containing monooxygenase n=1 Tax=Iamia sp. TaxID=2722710 RepID=UPI002BEF50AE|nr:NAD(P)/FAD-dependent oxidoreductase [Iamia sp.]HXH57349.1 NAD(P)/FAD-dependent oxidoreductase [Iamia sp.]
MTESPRPFDMVIVGAGFAGMYMLHRARGMGLDALVIEAGTGVGGTWFWNRYPGARCDVESMEYSYSFDDDLQQEWEWSERYAGQPEILRYAEHVADRFDLRSGIRFDTRVTAAHWDEGAGRWTVRADAGDAVSAQHLVMATGCLSAAMTPAIPGAERFAGDTFHTGRWPHEGVDLTGRRVGVIGTGSSGIQSIPVIAEEASELVVFQRTPAYTVPARNGPLDPAEAEAIKADYGKLRAADRLMPTAFGSRVPRRDEGALQADDDDRLAEYEARWDRGGFTFLGSFNDLLLDPAANETAAEFVRGKIRGVVQDPEVAERLAPSQVIGCKRLCIDTGYYETFNRPHVSLVDLRETPIEGITPTGIGTTAGHHDLDAIVFATGFDAMTGALARIDIRGRDGVALRDAWAAGPHTYLGLGVSGFPNLFTITGPGSPSVLTNMIVSIEHHVDWISDCVAHLRAHGHRTIEATFDAQEEWVDFVNSVAGLTLFPTCNSWYLGANVPGKTRVFMPLPGFPTYAETCAQVAADGYRGFALG